MLLDINDLKTLSIQAKIKKVNRLIYFIHAWIYSWNMFRPQHKWFGFALKADRPEAPCVKEMPDGRHIANCDQGAYR